MSEDKLERIGKVAREFNIGLSRAIEFLNSKGYSLRNDPNAKISQDQYNLLLKEFNSSLLDKKEASNLTISKKHGDDIIDKNKPVTREQEEDSEFFIKNLSSENTQTRKKEPDSEVKPTEIPKIKLDGPKVLGKIDLDAGRKQVSPVVPPAPVQPIIPVLSEEKQEELLLPVEEVVEEVVQLAEPTVEIELQEEFIQPAEAIVPSELIEARADTLKGLTVLGKIELPVDKLKKKDASSLVSHDKSAAEKKKRKRIKIEKPAANPAQGTQGRFDGNRNNGGGSATGDRDKRLFGKDAKPNEGFTQKDIQDQIRNTLAKLNTGGGSKQGANRARYRKEKRQAFSDAKEERLLHEQEQSKVLDVTEYISANDLASLMSVSVNEVIKVCMSLGMFVSINQRLDAEAITVISDEFGYTTKFISAEEEVKADVEEEEDDEEDLEDRAPIVTIMGHVDHGKTSLLDYIRKARVAAGEAGGITQHIGAYDVTTESGKKITFLDTPGHEAFTAMRARGAKVTDIVIIVVAADDSVMPQTREAINHAMVAGVPIVIAINKIDKPAANPDKIKEELAKENILVEDWGGKYQCELISAKSGKGIPELLEKVLLEAELLDLKANPDRMASGTVIEASLDKGRGYVTTVLVQTGTLEIGDVILAGAHFGRVKAMNDHIGRRVKSAGPSVPVQILGLAGAPQAGDKFNAMESEREAREIANKREQIIREQSIRTKKHITLDEIGRRLAIGNFKLLNIIIKGDVDGSVEALTDSLLKLSTEEVQVAIIHKGVGQISESDVLLASASDAIILGFNVRPSGSAKKLAEQEEIEIRHYSIIYAAINEIKDAMEGMLEPEQEEVIVGGVDIREVFKISKVGTIAGCYVTDGYIKRGSRVRLIRDGIVVYTGELASLKRFKDDVSEAKAGFECGLSIRNYNDVFVGDSLEVFETREVKRKLSNT